MRFAKTKLGIKSKLQYPLMILDSDKKILAQVSLPTGVPNVVAKELKSIVDDAIAGSKSVNKVVMIGITEEHLDSAVANKYTESNVAVFDSEEQAHAYAGKHRLSATLIRGFSSQVNYSDESVLSGCCDYRLESLSELPVNPE